MLDLAPRSAKPPAAPSLEGMHGGPGAVPMPALIPSGAPDRRRRSQARRYHAGLSAEAQVARLYQAYGAVLLEQRWRAPDRACDRSAGEIDLILLVQGVLVFVEVKARKSFGLDSPISQKQWDRLGLAAESYRLLYAERTGATPLCRFDAALVGPDGKAEVIQNARLN
ncbi:MAG: YraN family protein [Pseudomonadota bacterium]